MTVASRNRPAGAGRSGSAAKLSEPSSLRDAAVATLVGSGGVGLAVALREEHLGLRACTTLIRPFREVLLRVGGDPLHAALVIEHDCAESGVLEPIGQLGAPFRIDVIDL